MTSSPQLHVIFGTGPLGKWTARELVRLGHRVRLINRSGQAGDLPSRAEFEQGDASDAAMATHLARGAEAIYLCAQPAYHQWAGKFPQLQAALLQAAAATGAKLIAAENLYMYGDTHGQPMREDTPYQAHTRKGRVRQAMTETLFAAHLAGQVRVASMRGSDFFGPDDLNYAEQVFRPALSGRAITAIGSLDQLHTFTYTADFGRALATAGTQDQALGQVWHVPSEPPITQRDLIGQIQTEVNRPTRTRLGTPLMIRALGLINPGVRELVEMMYQFTQPFVMDSQKFTQTFGWSATPRRQQLQDTLAWVRDHPPAQANGSGEVPQVQDVRPS